MQFCNTFANCGQVSPRTQGCATRQLCTKVTKPACILLRNNWILFGRVLQSAQIHEFTENMELSLGYSSGQQHKTENSDRITNTHTYTEDQWQRAKVHTN